MSLYCSRKIKFINYIMTIEILLFHSSLKYAYPIIEDLRYVALNFFFLVSGYMCFKEENLNCGKLIKKRIKTLVIPFVIWNLVAIVFYSIKGRSLSLFKSVISLNFWISPLNYPIWYLMTLFLFILLTPLMKMAFKRKWSAVALLVFSVCVNVLGWQFGQEYLVKIPHVGAYLIRMCLYFPTFFIGAYIAHYCKSIIEIESYFVNLLGAAGTIICISVFKATTLNISARTLLWLFCCIMIWMMIPQKIFKWWNIWEKVVSPSFFLFVSHSMLIPVGAKIFVGESNRTYFLQVLFAVVAGSIIYYVIKKIFPKTWKIMSGNR